MTKAQQILELLNDMEEGVGSFLAKQAMKGTQKGVDKAELARTKAKGVHSVATAAHKATGKFDTQKQAFKQRDKDATRAKQKAVIDKTKSYFKR